MGFIIEACEKHGVKLSLILSAHLHSLSSANGYGSSIPMINIRYILLTI
jgi:hypothetical protein